MAGGTFQAMNKIRPGAYINFEQEPLPVSLIGTRGIVTFATALKWGEQGKIIEITPEDLLNGKTLNKIGLVYSDADALPIVLALQNAVSLKLYNTANGGTAASKTISEEVYSLTTDTEVVSGKTYYTRTGAGTEESPYVYTPVAEPATVDIGTYYEKITIGIKFDAKYKGTFGNKIAVVIKANGTKYDVETYADGYFVDSQRVATIDELVDNDFISFSKVGTGKIAEISSTLLTGGVDGSAEATGTYFPKYTALLETEAYNVIFTTSTEDTDKATYATFVEQQRENEGKYIQLVVSDYDAADYEGIINNVNGVVLNGTTTIAANIFTAWVAGATAGASITTSLTGTIVENATSIVNPLNNDQIIAGLQDGKFILALNQSGAVRVEKDIDSLHTFTESKRYMFSKNRVIRVLDEIGSGIRGIWENSFMGKVSADANGRAEFKASIIGYLTELQDAGAIQTFDTASISVIEGQEIDEVIASIAVQPIDSMEILYMTVNVG